MWRDFIRVHPWDCNQYTCENRKQGAGVPREAQNIGRGSFANNESAKSPLDNVSPKTHQPGSGMRGSLDLYASVLSWGNIIYAHQEKSRGTQRLYLVAPFLPQAAILSPDGSVC